MDFEALQKIRFQLVPATHTTSVAVYHHNVVGYELSKLLSVACSYCVQPRPSDSSDRRNSNPYEAV